MWQTESRPLPGHDPHGSSGWPPPTGQAPYGQPPAEPPAAPPAAPASDRRRGPGWLALIVAMLVTALVASGIALVGARAWDDPASTAAAPSTSARVQAPVPAPSGGATTDWTAVAAAVAPSVVTIQVQGQSGGGEGSGVVLDEGGNVLTNNHVVTGAGDGAEIRVVLSDGRVFSDVTVVGLDPTTDLAVLRIADPPSDLTPATLGDSSAVQPGQAVMAVGNPLGLSDSVTTGIVSAIDRPVTTQGEAQSPFGGGGGGAEPVVTNAIQTDAAINPGNSGGALVDASGTVIGINSSIASTGSSIGGQAGNIGVGFAIPINEAKRIADELVKNGKAEHAWLGVYLQNGSATADGVQRQAATIARVTDGTPASTAGLKSGDAVVGINDEAVTGAESLTAQIRERAPGTKVTLTVIRGGSSQKIDVTLGTRPEG